VSPETLRRNMERKLKRYNQEICQYLESNPLSTVGEMIVGTGYSRVDIEKSIIYLTNNEMIDFHRTDKGNVRFYNA
jgi:hypothetical protein